jgi:hypothetical protein
LVVPKKLSCLVSFFAYGGNSGISKEHPSCREWAVETQRSFHGDPRLDRLDMETFNDTPITMLRNRAVEFAREGKYDLLVMVDSDHELLYHEKAPWYKPFFPEAFNAIYNHYEKGPLVIAAPYAGGAGQGENMFVFQWDNHGERDLETAFSLDQYTRAQASQMSGIQPCGALPTGLIMYDMRIFDLLDINRKSKEQVLMEFKDGKLNLAEALRCIQDGYFYYEWTDHTASKKASTEDVSATRDMSIVGQLELGYNPVMCAWDSWIGHVKPTCSGKPRPFSVDQVGGFLKRVVIDNQSTREKLVRVDNKFLKALLDKRKNGVLR